MLSSEELSGIRSLLLLLRRTDGRKLKLGTEIEVGKNKTTVGRLIDDANRVLERELLGSPKKYVYLVEYGYDSQEELVECDKVILGQNGERIFTLDGVIQAVYEKPDKVFLTGDRMDDILKLNKAANKDKR